MIGSDLKMATGGSPFAPSRIPPVNQPKVQQVSRCNQQEKII